MHSPSWCLVPLIFCRWYSRAHLHFLLLHAPLQQRPNDYGIPVAVEVTYVQDNFLTSDVLNEMVRPQFLRQCCQVVSKCFSDMFFNVLFCFVCLFADVAGWFLQGSSRPRPLHPLLVPWYHHAGQDQGRTTNAGLYVHIYICVCLCVYSQYNDVTAANQVAASPNCIVDVKVAGVSSPILENWSSVGAFRRMCHLN